jgi:hypothetical protein
MERWSTALLRSSTAREFASEEAEIVVRGYEADRL